MLCVKISINAHSGCLWLPVCRRITQRVTAAPKLHAVGSDAFRAAPRTPAAFIPHAKSQSVHTWEAGEEACCDTDERFHLSQPAVGPNSDSLI